MMSLDTETAQLCWAGKANPGIRGHKSQSTERRALGDVCVGLGIPISRFLVCHLHISPAFDKHAHSGHRGK